MFVDFVFGQIFPSNAACRSQKTVIRIRDGQGSGVVAVVCLSAVCRDDGGFLGKTDEDGLAEFWVVLCCVVFGVDGSESRPMDVDCAFPLVSMPHRECRRAPGQRRWRC